MMRQYLETKARVPDALLFFRLGDFYELFFDDAVTAAGLLEITLTSRSKGDDRVPMCGVPFHAAKGYVAKLVGLGHKVAICDQVEEPGGSQKLFRRELTRVVTPGMVLDEELLDPKQSRWLASIAAGEGGRLGVGFLDLSTGELRATELGASQLLDELWRHAPSEILVAKGVPTAGLDALGASVQPAPAAEAGEADLLAAHLGPDRGAAMGLSPGPAALACDQLLRYALRTQLRTAAHVDRVEVYRPSERLVLDEASRQNLEICRTLRDGKLRGSLLGVLDRTQTAMGSRLLADWLQNPLLDLALIGARHDVVGELAERAVVREDAAAELKGVRDVERLSARLSLGQGSPRDLRALGDSLARLPDLQRRLSGLAAPLVRELSRQLSGLEELAETLQRALLDEPAQNLREGGLVRPGWSQEVDELLALAQGGKATLAALEASERERTGIGSLKIRFNRVFGYYLEVTTPNLHLVPADWVRRQTTAGGERFVTEPLKAWEAKVLGAEERRIAVEARIFEELRQRVCARLPSLRTAARALATIDVLVSLSRAAAEYGYVRPDLDDGDELFIEDGRHPVVERMLGTEPFVPNDTRLDRKSCQLVILTGPNMAGKSTVLRQAALIVLMAQAGSFVPARRARIGRCDRIFTRVGASDNLARGQSTFMVEMSETSAILRQASARSLVILDEIGRGTSTFDGLSIAWAVAEHLHDRIGARTLFATHYHELTDLARDRPRVRNASLAVREENGRVVFLRKLVDGGASRSYGIEVARLAGLPREVVERAREILLNLESGELDEEGLPALARARRGRARVAPPADQLRLFAPPASAPSKLEEALRGLEVDRTTPLEALSFLAEWQRRLREG
ncbi:MAG: DNA mismatch repair protein MutS [Deltaproteobacteria bacterium]